MPPDIAGQAGAGAVGSPRRRFAAAALCVIAAGLALRLWGYEARLPFVVVKYGGSILWGSMVYLLAAACAGGRSIGLVAGASAALAVAVELSRLHHTPELDAFRLTTAGALLLGRVFSPWNILAYLVGIAAAAALTRRWRPIGPGGRR